MDRIALTEKLIAAGVIVKHERGSQLPHPELSSGLHSDTFYRRGPIEQDATLMADVAVFLAHELSQHVRVPLLCVIGVPNGGTMLAAAIAERMLGAHAIELRKNGSEVDVSSIPCTDVDCRHVLFCEDVITTGASIRSLTGSLDSMNGFFLPHIAALVNRSGRDMIGTKRVHSVIEAKPSHWKPQDCELCAMGSLPLRPDEHNWRQFIK